MLMEATLLVLAGGMSRRMGRPKPWIEVGDTVLLRYVVERLTAAFSEVMVSFSEPEQMEQLDVTWLEGLDPAQFESLNTQSDLERFHAAFSAQR